METPVKMSQFEVESPLPSGSYFIVVTPDGVVWNNRRLSVDDVLVAINGSRWKTVPTSPATIGNDGDEARDDSGNYYLHTGGLWRKFIGQPF
jgi:hypothetical protein